MLMIYVVDFFIYSGPYHYVVYLYSDAFMCIFLNWFLYIMLLPTFLWFSSAVNAHQFFTEETWDSFKQIFDTYMVEASKVFLRSCFVV